MKQTIIISLLSLSAIGSFAQSQEMEATQRMLIHERAKAVFCATNGNMGPATIMHYNTNYSNVHATYPDAPVNAVPAKPSGNYVALQDPPCYKYKNANGREVTECPGASATGKPCELKISGTQSNGNLQYSRENTYMGYYNNLQAIYPEAPKNAVAAWPTTPYAELQNPPCYKYINKRGLEVTECPGAQFEPEHLYR